MLNNLQAKSFHTTDHTNSKKVIILRKTIILFIVEEIARAGGC